MRVVGRIAWIAGVALVVLVAVAAVWFAVAGTDFVWSQMRPGEAELLAGEEIPERLTAGAWEEDLAFVEREVPQRFVGFSETVDREAFDTDVRELRARLPDLDRDARLLGLMDLMALPVRSGAGHTGVFPLQRPVDWEIYPFYAYLFDDGLWITVAGAGAEEALGSEVLAVGGRPVEELLAAAAPSVTADNAVGRSYRLAAWLSLGGLLHGLGATEDDGAVELRLRGDGGEPFDLRLEPFPLASLAGLRWGRRMQEPTDSWSPADPRPRRRNYALDYRAEQRALILRFNAVRDQPDGESLEELAARLDRMARENPVDRFVIDLRSNGGGDNQLTVPLVEVISGHPVLDRRGVIYTLLGRRTFSAAGNFATALERRTKTLFVGEPGGFSPNHAGDAMSLALPNSKLLVDVSTRAWNDGGPFDHRPWIAPDVPVALRHDDHFGGRDPALAAALSHRPEPLPALSVRPQVLRALPGRYRFGPFQVLELAVDGGRPTLEVTGVDRFLTSDLHPVAQEGGRVRFATDLSGVYLDADTTDGTLVLDWHGAVHSLPPVTADYRVPVELLREDRLQEGIAAFRRLAADGHVPDSHTEFYLNGLGYRLLSEDRADDAVAVFRLQADLYPTVPNVFDSLGDGERRAGRPEEAARAYRQALDLDPTFAHPREMLEELGAEGGGPADERP